MWLMKRWVLGPLPPGVEVAAHPMVLAAWLGLLVTMLNLVPLGQLDGGHLAFAALGDGARRVGQVSAAVLAGLTLFVSAGWLLWLVVTVLLVGFGHPPVSRPELPLGRGRRWICVTLCGVPRALPHAAAPARGVPVSGEPMRFHCTACGLLVRASGFRVEGARLILACERCGTEASVRVGGERDRRTRAESAAVQAAARAATSPAPATQRRSVMKRRARRGRRSSADRPPPSPRPQAESRGGAAAAASCAVAVSVQRADGPSAAQRAASASIPAVPEGHCPRCLAQRSPAARGCAGCGLDFLRVRSESLAPSARLAASWSALQEAWEDPAAHQDFLQRAIAAGELSGAGRLYRLLLLHRPEDAHAQRALERMRQQALATWLIPSAEASGAARSPRALRWVLLLLLVLAGALVTAAVWARFPAPPAP